MMAPSGLNGFRLLSLERVAAVVYELAVRCTDLYRTKLQKAMSFTDLLCYARTARSMTGMRYAHANYGPVMDGSDKIVAALQDGGVVRLSEKGWGEVVLPGRRPAQALSDDELGLVDEVARLVNTFATSSDISSFSHELAAWKETESGQLIEYGSNAEQVEEAIGHTMSGRL